MQIQGVTIEDTFAEAFPMWASRLVITAETANWAETAARAAAGLATSVVGCGCEAGLTESLPPEATPDGRPGQVVLLFTVSKESMERELIKRIGQGVLTAPTSACYNGLESAERIPAGGKLRYFGDGAQASKRLEERRFWRVPVADGEFLVEEDFGVVQGVGGGNLLILAADRRAGLDAACAAAAAVRARPDAIAPFPGGVCRSPSKVGSRYAGLRASSNLAYCPTQKSRPGSALPEGAQAAYELVIDGLSEAAVGAAMRAALLAACRPGVLQISAGNYGGKLGPYHYHLHDLLAEREDANQAAL